MQNPVSNNGDKQTAGHDDQKVDVLGNLEAFKKTLQELPSLFEEVLKEQKCSDGKDPDDMIIIGSEESIEQKGRAGKLTNGKPAAAVSGKTADTVLGSLDGEEEYSVALSDPKIDNPAATDTEARAANAPSRRLKFYTIKTLCQAGDNPKSMEGVPRNRAYHLAADHHIHHGFVSIDS